MTDDRTEHPTDGDRDDGLTFWGVAAGVLTMLVFSPAVLFLSLQGAYVGAVAVLVFVGGLVFYLVRSRQRSLGYGIALGYVLLTVASGGICTGWNQGVWG
ncbi:MAG: hypothetical protein R3290_03265 [Acidimicrobiia bacterium]|nr:hypothetical protein [Acidimicrobiia bacterium]